MNALLSRPWARIAIGLVAPALFLIWLQWQAMAGDARSLAFAPLGSIGAAFVELIENGVLFSDILSTLSRSLTGLAIGGTLGIAMGVAMAIWAPLDRVLGPLLHAIRQVPMLGWLPLLGLWFVAAVLIDSWTVFRTEPQEAQMVSTGWAREHTQSPEVRRLQQKSYVVAVNSLTNSR